MLPFRHKAGLPPLSPVMAAKRSTKSRLEGWLILLIISSAFSVAASVPEPVRPAPSASGSLIVVGFVGGFVHRDDRRHSEVQLGEKLRAEFGDRAHVEVFQNRHRKNAHAAVIRWLDQNRDGGLADSERGKARIILYGHSWGASAAIGLARELQKERIPVLLTVQVDSIAKPGLNDHIVPSNVARAINFYQTHGLLHGRQQIVAADPAHTQLLGNFRFEYAKTPEACSEYPWVARHLFKGHTAIECDPNVWSRIETLINECLAPLPIQSASSSDQAFQPATSRASGEQ